MNDRNKMKNLARFDQLRTAASDCGKPVECSEMEIGMLCTLANLGMTYLFTMLDDPVAKDAEQRLEGCIENIRTFFARKKGGDDGLVSLMESGVAMFMGDKFGGWAVDENVRWRR